MPTKLNAYGTVQAVATVIAAFAQVAVKEWMFANIPRICQPNQKSSLTCPHNQVFFTASAIWSVYHFLFQRPHPEYVY